MITLAVLITCFNRKEKTLRCVSDIKQSELNEKVLTNIYIVDGGSSDGTVESIRRAHTDVKVEIHDGLYWAGGMRAAWKMADNSGVDYDFYWLVNDDTIIYADTLQKLLDAETYALRTYGKRGMYVGSTKSAATQKFSYGGRKLRNSRHMSADKIMPDGEYHLCDLANANILLVSKEVYRMIGGFCEIYTHGIADYDYSLRAVRADFPVMVVPGYCGECEDDHGNNWAPSTVGLRQRLTYLYSPKGLAYKEYLYYVKTFFPTEYLTAYCKLWLKIFVPQLWEKKQGGKIRMEQEFYEV